MRFGYWLICMLGAQLGWAQMGNLTGTVQHKELGEAYVSVGIPALGIGTTTDQAGNFTLVNLPAGEHIVRVQHLGYQSIQQPIVIQENQTTTVTFQLLPDQLELEQIVVTGSRQAVPIHTAAVVVSRISNLTFEKTQSLAVSEGLNFSPGLRVENNCQNCGFTQLRMNGLDGAYSQILINSRPIFSALAGVYGLDLIPTNMVDRIEVVRGGGSVLYGGNAIAGTVNIITKNPIQNSYEVGLNHGLINGEAADRTLSFNGSLVSEDGKQGISLYGFNRQRDFWDANGDGISEITELHNTTFGIDAFFNPTEQWHLKLNLYHLNEYRRGGSQFDLAPHQTDITEMLDHRILGGSLNADYYSKNDRHHLSLYTSAQRVARDSYYGGGGRVLGPGDTLTADDILAINAYGESRDLSLVAGAQYNTQPLDALRLTVGSEYQYNDVIDAMPGYERTIDQQVGTWGSFAQVEWHPVKRLTVLTGGRLDQLFINGQYDLVGDNFINDRNLTVLVPRLNAMYQLTDRLKLRAAFAQGYRAPQAFDEDLHIETVGGAARFIRLDPDLTTERSNSYTVSANYTQTTGRIQTDMVVEGFYTQLQNPFILSNQTELPSGVAVITKRNGAGAQVSGLNLEANLALGSTWIFQLGGTLQTATYDETEVIWEPETPSDERPVVATDRMVRTPNTYGFYSITWNGTERFSAILSGIYTGSMVVPHIIDPTDEYTILEETPPFFEQNLKLTYDLPIAEDYVIQFFGGVQNLFNSFQDNFDIGPDRDAGFVFGPSRPRTYYGGLKLQWR